MAPNSYWRNVRKPHIMWEVKPSSGKYPNQRAGEGDSSSHRPSSSRLQGRLKNLTFYVFDSKLDDTFLNNVVKPY